ncbi:MAG: ribbon-helix-helix protein, CopG family [Candidatus Rokubacteria bacterium]|nr:ribbon-helix-helix protein, CopG family [Candidatus Rokubacteria bacterium]
MRVISLVLDDDVDRALDALCAAQGRDKGEVVTEVLRTYVETARLRSTLKDPELTSLYEELAPDDVALADEGFEEYGRLLRLADDA